MSNRISNSEKRRIDILRRATMPLPGTDIPLGCLMNTKWCFALTTERAVKQLVDKGLLLLKREKYRKTYGRTVGYATQKGVDYLLKFDGKRT